MNIESDSFIMIVVRPDSYTWILEFALVQKIPSKECKVIFFSERFLQLLISMEILGILLKRRQSGL